MSTAVSNYLLSAFDTLIKNGVPQNYPLSESRRQELIKLAVTRVHALYVDNDLGVYDDTVSIDFYNSASGYIKRRGTNTDTVETRWIIVTPASFYACKLKSCSLNTILPSGIPLPTPISFVHDITISIKDSRDVNTAVPSANTGYCSLLESQRLLNSLTMDNTNNTWQNVMQITAWLTYYRPPIVPNFTDPTSCVDILEKDFKLAWAYVMELMYGNAVPFYVKELIQQREKEIKYGS